MTENNKFLVIFCEFLGISLTQAVILSETFPVVYLERRALLFFFAVFFTPISGLAFSLNTPFR